MARMKVLPLLSLSLLAGAYVIDDRDPMMIYSGSSTWQRFSDASAYWGTTTDNTCWTAQNCQFTFSFTGSGVSLTRYLMPSSPSGPLAATVTIDGVPRADISIPDQSPATVVYNLQQLSYGFHSMRVVLVSYNGAGSHFRLDYVTVNETAPAPTPVATPSSTTGSPPPKTSSTTSATKSATPLPQLPPKPKKTHMGVMIGGVVGGVALVILICVLVLLVVLRRRRARVEPPLPYGGGPGAEFSQIDNWSTTPPATSATIASPPASFYSFNARATDGLILGQRPYAPPPVPEASGFPRVDLPHASIIAAQPVVTSPILSSSANAAAPSITSVVSASTAELLPSGVKPTKAAGIQDPGYEDSSSVMMTPTDSTIGSRTLSISSSAPLVRRSTRYLTDDQVDFVATLYRQQLPPQDVARIINGMLDEGEIGDEG